MYIPYVCTTYHTYDTTDGPAPPNYISVLRNRVKTRSHDAMNAKRTFFNASSHSSRCFVLFCWARLGSASSKRRKISLSVVDASLLVWASNTNRHPNQRSPRSILIVRSLGSFAFTFTNNNKNPAHCKALEAPSFWVTIITQKRHKQKPTSHQSFVATNHRTIPPIPP